MRDADLAVYRAKARGKAQYAVFEPGMEQESVERFELMLRRPFPEAPTQRAA